MLLCVEFIKQIPFSHKHEAKQNVWNLKFYIQIKAWNTSVRKKIVIYLISVLIREGLNLLQNWFAQFSLFALKHLYIIGHPHITGEGVKQNITKYCGGLPDIAEYFFTCGTITPLSSIYAITLVWANVWTTNPLRYIAKFNWSSFWKGISINL